MTSITGLILAGGAGRRVAGRDKGLIDWQGRPLAAHVAQRLRPQVDSLLISCNRNFQRYAGIVATTIADTRRDFQGPVAGLEAATPYVHSEFLAVTACDTPELPLDLVARLLRSLLTPGTAQTDIAFAHDGDRAQYLCAVMRSSALQSISGFLDSGQRSVRGWYQTQRSAAVDFSDEADCFRNYNRIK